MTRRFDVPPAAGPERDPSAVDEPRPVGEAEPPAPNAIGASLVLEGSTTARSVGPIWLNPIAILLVGTALQLWWMDHANWNGAHAAAVVVGCTAFAITAHHARPPRHGPTDVEARVVVKATRIVGLLMVVGYAVWTAIAVTRGFSVSTVVDFFTLQPNASERLKRDVFAPTLLATFFVNLTVVYFGLAGTMAFKLGGRRRSRRDRLAKLRHVPFLRIVAVCTILRAVLLSERLVAMEMVVGLVVAYFVGNAVYEPDVRKERRRKQLRRRAPVYLLVGTMLFFGLAELPRSFAGKRAEQEVANPIEYSADRIVAYYGTAGDNGEMSLRYVRPVWDDGLFLSMPFLTAIVGNEDDVVAGWTELLDRHEDREFNSPNGWTSVLADFGVPVGLVVLALVFFLLGHWWSVAMPRPPVLAIVGPVVILTALEFPRLFYPGQTRVVIALFIAVLLQGAAPRARRTMAA